MQLSSTTRGLGRGPRSISRWGFNTQQAPYPILNGIQTAFRMPSDRVLAKPQRTLPDPFSPGAFGGAATPERAACSSCILRPSPPPIQRALRSLLTSAPTPHPLHRPHAPKCAALRQQGVRARHAQCVPGAAAAAGAAPLPPSGRALGSGGKRAGLLVARVAQADQDTAAAEPSAVAAAPEVLSSVW